MSNFQISFNTSRSGQPGIAGKLFASVLMLVFVAAGCALAGYGVWKSLQVMQSRSWPTVPCTITRSRVVTSSKSENPYKFEVEYSYKWAGKAHTSKQYAHDHNRSSDYAEEERLQLRYPEKSAAVCHVNPAKPSDAVLALDSYSILSLVPFGLVFAAFGALPLWALWRGGWLAPGRAGPGRPLSQGAITQRGGRRAGWVICAIFTLIGGLLVVFMLILPLLRAREAASWRKAPCQVVSSSVMSHSGEHGSTYSIDILYKYRVNSHEYRSNRFNFDTGSSSGYAGKFAIVQQYPRGRKTICYVNPADPTDAVLEPTIGNAGWWAILPGLFLAIGVAGLSLIARSAAQGRSAAATFGPAQSGRISRFIPATLASVNDSPLVLRPTQKPLGKFIGVLLMAMLFNGICVLVLRQTLRERTGGGVDIFLIVWSSIWGLGCLVLIMVVIRTAMSLANPRLTVKLSRGAVPPGSSAEINWSFTGRSDRISRLQFWLEGREEATFPSGDSTSTQKKVFAKLPLIDTTRNMEIANGRGVLAIPAGAMHTFRALHNKVHWVLVTRGDIPGWTDMKEEFEIEVPPAPATEIGRLELPPVREAANLPSELAIETTDGQTRFTPGSVVSGIGSWKPHHPPASVQIRFFWYTSGKGTPDVTIVDQLTIDNPQPAGARGFAFRVPAGPSSFEGKLISLGWGLEIVALPKNRAERLELICAPGAQVISLNLPATAVK